MVPNVVYGVSGGEPLLLDVYTTSDAEDRPSLVLIHGGSWRGKDKRTWEVLAPTFVEAGYTVFAPNYRLAPPGGDTIFPGAVEDVGMALAWVRRNADRFGADPLRVGMIGSSAGGHLSLLASGTGTDRPDAVAAYSAPTALRRLHNQGVLVGDIENFLGCPPRKCPRTYRRASTVHAADESNPPTFLAYSWDEMIPRSQGRVMADRLGRDGVEYQLAIAAGDSHGMRLAPKLIGETLEFMDLHL